jgi:preprotein translocase subunit SecE
VGLIYSALRAVIAWADMASKTNPFTFLQQVRAETSKVTWPSRRETMISTAMVLVMVIFAALFFFAADQLIGWLISLVLNISI